MHRERETEPPECANMTTFQSWGPRMFSACLLLGKSVLWYEDSRVESHELLDLGFYSGIL